MCCRGTKMTEKSLFSRSLECFLFLKIPRGRNNEFSSFRLFCLTQFTITRNLIYVSTGSKEAIFEGERPFCVLCVSCRVYSIRFNENKKRTNLRFYINLFKFFSNLMRIRHQIRWLSLVANLIFVLLCFFIHFLAP